MSEAPKIDVRALARLSRLEVSDAEVAKLEKELPGILAFVETIQSASVTAGSAADVTELHNVLRSDDNPYESGVYTEEILSAAPHREGDRIAVKQVISREKAADTSQ
ncbi:MAG TPA: Asp-tRNA(Asn)/Glu-tRNA(Gln) amidotransferase subunit GatC [Candidatus Paceibacterota bacterium]|nr:Asp-tRNA(Asn)/Glu-tRNA(Gln) amidotransferase subunit GatC [Candidatus Paceibacterota bacterium]